MAGRLPLRALGTYRCRRLEEKIGERLCGQKGGFALCFPCVAYVKWGKKGGIR
jgi:hypothetical protein